MPNLKPIHRPPSCACDDRRAVPHRPLRPGDVCVLVFRCSRPRGSRLQRTEYLRAEIIRVEMADGSVRTHVDTDVHDPAVTIIGQLLDKPWPQEHFPPQLCQGAVVRFRWPHVYQLNDAEPTAASVAGPKPKSKPIAERVPA